MVLVLGILSIAGFGCLTGIPAWIMGNSSLAEIENGRQPESERALVQAGRLLGIITTLLSTVGVCFYLMLAASFSAVMANDSHGPDIDWASIQKSMEAGTLRRKILDDAITERTQHPEKDYKAIAAELQDALDRSVSWKENRLTPPEGCGAYLVSAKGGKLILSDDCGSDSLYGWPAEKDW